MMQVSNQIIKTLLLIFCLSSFLLLTACQGDSDTNRIRKYMDEVKARPVRPIEPIPTLKPYQTAKYNAHKKRNPFQRQITVSGEQPDLNRVKGPLEAFSLDSLKMIGTLHEGQKLWAIVAAPDGSVYAVTVGDYLGKNYGKITEVTEKGIILVETVPIAGGWEKRKSHLDFVEQ